MVFAQSPQKLLAVRPDVDTNFLRINIAGTYVVGLVVDFDAYFVVIFFALLSFLAVDQSLVHVQ